MATMTQWVRSARSKETSSLNVNVKGRFYIKGQAYLTEKCEEIVDLYEIIKEEKNGLKPSICEVAEAESVSWNTAKSIIRK